ncbi:hypothetical protein BGW38_005504, partial [Lunasporangiospora selenospora]
SIPGILGSAHYEPTSSYPSLSKKRKIASRPMVEALNRFGFFIRTLICEDAASPLLRTITPNCLGLETLIIGTGSGLTAVELNKNTLRRLELTPYRNFMLPTTATAGVGPSIDEYDFAALTMGQTRQGLNSFRLAQREPALRSKEVLEAIMDLKNLEHLVVDHLGLRSALELSEFFQFCGQLTSLELYNVAIVDLLPPHLRQPTMVGNRMAVEESPESLDTSFGSQDAEVIVLPRCAHCRMEATVLEDEGDAINMAFKKLRFVSLVNLWMPIQDQFLFLAQCPSLEHVTWIRQGHEIPLSAFAYHHHVRFHHLNAVCSPLMLTHPESPPYPLMLSLGSREESPQPTHAFRTLTSLDISNNTLQDADIAATVRELRHVLRRFYARDSRHLGESTIQNLTDSAQEMEDQPHSPYNFVPGGYIERLEVLDMTDCPGVSSKMVLKVLQTCKALRCLSADQINTLDLLPTGDNSKAGKGEEQEVRGKGRDPSDLKYEQYRPRRDPMASPDRRYRSPYLETPSPQQRLHGWQFPCLNNQYNNTLGSKGERETCSKPTHPTLSGLRSVNILASDDMDLDMTAGMDKCSHVNGDEGDLEGIIPWACEETLEELRVTFVGRVMQQFVYRQVSRLRRLRVLSMGHNGSSVKTHTQGLIPSAVELSLQSGLSMLGTLGELQEFGFLHMDHKLTIGELRWMLQCWPRLETLCGVFHPTDKNRDTLMERFLLSAKPSIRLHRKLKNRQGYVKLDDML